MATQLEGDIVTFRADERPVAEDTAEFGTRFAQYRLLLLKVADRSVLAASRGDDIAALVDRFREVCGDVADEDCIVFHGPAAFEQAARAMAEESPSPTSVMNR